MKQEDRIRLIVLELNEINFDLIREYARQGQLPAFRGLIEKHGITETDPCEPLSEQELQPWIQWVTVHTGLPYSSHRILDQGDMVNKEFRQIWEELESTFGVSVGAMSPMNAANRTKDSKFFMPDPWTRTAVTGPSFLKPLSAAYSQVVGDNAGGKVGFWSALTLARVFLRCVPWSVMPELLGYGFRGLKQRHYRAIFLDRLLSEVFLNCCRKTRPGFATLFLNGTAHVQHHSIDDSALLKSKTPDEKEFSGDALLKAYRSYDVLVERTLRLFPEARLMIATAISGVPRQGKESEFYYRLKRPEALLERLGLAYERVEPRMSTTFTIRCRTEAEAGKCREVLEGGRTAAGKPVLAVWSKNPLEVEFSSPQMSESLPKNTTALFGAVNIEQYDEWVEYVGERKGDHSPKGYLIDTATPEPAGESIPLGDIRKRILEAFAVRTHAPVTPEPV